MASYTGGFRRRSSLIGEAVLYTLNQEVYLKRYLEDGHLSIDNLAAERALKNFATGRRNWLFAKSIRGAQASAAVYSITETAMLQRAETLQLLTYVMEQIERSLVHSGPKGSYQELLSTWSTACRLTAAAKLKNMRGLIYSPGIYRGFSYFVKVRMITYLHMKNI